MQKIMTIFMSLKMTIISGVFLTLSLILMINHISFPLDLAWISIFLSGLPLLYSALTRLFFQKWISSALLISMAMVASIAIGQIFAAGEVAFIMAIGGILEDKTVSRAKKGLSSLISLVPTSGRRLTIIDGEVVESLIPIEQVKTGHILRVLPGEKIPVDGKIISGETTVDQSIITGESLPIDKMVGNKVFCGTLNCHGSVDIEATSVGEDSSLEQLVSLVKEAESKKAPMERIVDKWAVWLVPIALFIAIFVFLINYYIGYEFLEALTRGVTVLVVFCPCALALATPTSIMAAIGQATKHGVIIKSGGALETMGKVDTIAFDKTGTLTVGQVQLDKLISFSPQVNIEKLLSLAASAESKSEHPLGKAIYDYGKKTGSTIKESTSFAMTMGKGVSARVDGSHILCGNLSFMKDESINVQKEPMQKIEEISKEGKAVVLVAYNKELIGLISLSDGLRPHAKEVISQLKKVNINTVLVTGDNEKSANFFSQKLGISSVFSALLPSEKVSTITDIQKTGKKVCMIGDGVNDAPALKIADVSISMGNMGSDIAIESADISLIGDDLVKIPYLNRLSKSTIKTIKGNIIASMAINAIAITLSAFGLLNPITGAIVHNVGSVLVVLNAVLLYDRHFYS